MKKIISLLLCAVFALNLSVISSFAADMNMEVKYITTTAELDNIDNSTKLVMIHKDDLPFVDEQSVREVLDSEISVMFYGDSLSFSDIKTIAGDTTEFNVEMSPDLENKITGICISKRDGKYEYNGVVDATDVMVVNNETNEAMSLSEIENSSNENCRRRPVLS